jgi:hypothetical protein
MLQPVYKTILKNIINLQNENGVSLEWSHVNKGHSPPVQVSLSLMKRQRSLPVALKNGQKNLYRL